MPETAQERKRAKWRGRKLERACAKAMRGVVVGRSKAVRVGDNFVQVNPGAPPDVLAPGGFSFECKNRPLPKSVEAAINQAARNAPAGYSPYVWWYAKRADGQRGEVYIITTRAVFLDMHGPG